MTGKKRIPAPAKPAGSAKPGKAAKPTPAKKSVKKAAKPARRKMDDYGKDVRDAFANKPRTFHNGTFTDDKSENLISDFGFFKVESYPNQANPADIQRAVYFHNKVTKETFEVHGTLARDYLSRVRGGALISDFPTSDTRAWRADKSDEINFFSRYSLRWERKTNKVLVKHYTPWAPGNAKTTAKLHEFDPLKNDTLVACSEEFAIASKTLNFTNWKDVKDLGKYDPNIRIRSVGRPTQILLHETAGFGNLSIGNVALVKKGNDSYYAIPHFCVNKLSDDGKGNIIQFVDTAVNVIHGEVTNQRAVGIEFVNAPFEEYTKDKSGKKTPKFKLDAATHGIYLKTKLAGFPKLFIPLQFSATAQAGFVELVIKKSQLVNYTALKGGVGPGQAVKVLADKGKTEVTIRFAKSDMFEHLATLVRTLIRERIIVGLTDPAVAAIWKPVIPLGSTLGYLFDNAWTKVKGTKETHYFVDVRQPGIFTHRNIGGHADGTLQGLYLYLRFVRKVPSDRLLQLMITLLTSARTTAETAGVELESVVLFDGATLKDPPKPIKRKFTDVLELDAAAITAATKTTP